MFGMAFRGGENYPVVLRIFDVSNRIGHLTHGFDANDTFKSKIGLKRKPSRKVISGDCKTVSDYHIQEEEGLTLVVWLEGEVNQVAGPLLPQSIALPNPFLRLFDPLSRSTPAVVEALDIVSSLEFAQCKCTALWVGVKVISTKTGPDR